jgi:hypothetical protein
VAKSLTLFILLSQASVILVTYFHFVAAPAIEMHNLKPLNETNHHVFIISSLHLNRLISIAFVLFYFFRERRWLFLFTYGLSTISEIFQIYSIKATLICIYSTLLSIFNIDLIDLFKRLCYWLFNITFRYVIVVSFIGGWKESTLKRPSTCNRLNLATNF